MTNTERKALIRQMWGTTTSEVIADTVGLHASTVRSHAKRMGLPPARTGRPPVPRGGIRAGRAKHGTRYNYSRGCGCAACVEAGRKPVVPRAARAPVALHGTRSRYQKGCKCPECVEAQSEYSRMFRLRRLRRDDAVAEAVAAPQAWRCPCDAWRINRGAVCGSCGQAPPWMAAGNNELQGAG